MCVELPNGWQSAHTVLVSWPGVTHPQPPPSRDTVISSQVNPLITDGHSVLADRQTNTHLTLHIIYFCYDTPISIHCRFGLSLVSGKAATIYKKLD